MPHGKTQTAITLTREILLRALDEPGIIVLMSINEVNPEEVEDTVKEVLKYIEKTAPKEAEA